MLQFLLIGVLSESCAMEGSEQAKAYTEQLEASEVSNDEEWAQFKGTFYMAMSLRIGHLLEERGWKLVTHAQQKDADILLGQSAYEFDWTAIDKRNGAQLVNRMWGENVLASKGSLQAVIKHRFPSLANSILPRTFRMYDPEECVAFYDEKPTGVWIEKPTHEARGRGIQVFASFDKIVETRGGRYTCPWTSNMLDGDELETTHESGTLMQKYIENPLLIDGKKSEMRMYWAILSADPWIVAVYPEGTVRLCSETYDPTKLDDPLRHITNTFQQKKSPRAKEAGFEDSLKITFDSLQPRLQALFPSVPGIEQYMNTTFWNDVRTIITGAVRSGMPFMKARVGGFALHAVDLIMDDNLNVRMTEIQRSPGMSLDGIKRPIILGLLNELLDIVLEIRWRRQQGLPIVSPSLLTIRKWSIVIDESVSPPYYHNDDHR
jgi:hypothetical protein